MEMVHFYAKRILVIATVALFVIAGYGFGPYLHHPLHACTPGYGVEERIIQKSSPDSNFYSYCDDFAIDSVSYTFNGVVINKMYEGINAFTVEGYKNPTSLFTPQRWIIEGTDPATSEHKKFIGEFYFSKYGILNMLEPWLLAVVGILVVLLIIVELHERIVNGGSLFGDTGKFSVGSIFFGYIAINMPSAYHIQSYSLLSVSFAILAFILGIVGIAQNIQKKKVGVQLSMLGIFLSIIALAIHLL